jgi:hypothetical protein
VLPVTDVARLWRPTLSRAEHEVSVIYRSAGVVTSWVDRSTSPGPADRVVDIIVVSDMRAAARITEYGLGHDDLGFAIVPAQRAYILWPRIRDAEVQLSKDPGEILGRVIAHEVGHLLLAVEGHSSEGIMRSDVDLNSRRWPHFTPSEAALIRAALPSAGSED